MDELYELMDDDCPFKELLPHSWESVYTAFGPAPKGSLLSYKVKDFSLASGKTTGQNDTANLVHFPPLPLVEPPPKWLITLMEAQDVEQRTTAQRESA